jgi:hypothetical protein
VPCHHLLNKVPPGLRRVRIGQKVEQLVTVENRLVTGGIIAVQLQLHAGSRVGEDADAGEDDGVLGVTLACEGLHIEGDAV